MPIIPKHMNKVSVNFQNMSYSYLDESSRGQSGRDTEQENISGRVLRVISFCDDIMRKLNLFKKKSKGQEKLFNMMSIFTSYNLNHVRIIYFDEPENFLDEEFLKVIAEFSGILLECNFVIRVATHNSRLLNILKVDLEDIIFFTNHSQFTVDEDEVKDLYRITSTQIESIRAEKKIQIDASIQYKLDLLNHPHAFDSFIEQNLKSEEFYRCLFYKQVIIVEGNSDITALSSMKNAFDSSLEIFNPNGKAFIPFFVELFIKLRKEVTVIIDGDIPVLEENTSLRHPVAITHYLKAVEARNEIKLVIHTPDLEGFYNIDLVQIGNYLGMSSAVRNHNRGWHKSLAAFIFFRDEGNRQRLKNHILGRAEESLFEFQ
ncbi:TOPRIM nucleotidyl transferase/hydrolase domain-containing protein [Paenibacillus sp. CN-4]|uniref:TOPRIM nucleotidyl transferase/hydrolase domain-containing protein n=1 Tax=Paenibacillus nanchangensis TaxID=3348343 RepID=UPI00397972A2